MLTVFNREGKVMPASNLQGNIAPNLNNDRVIDFVKGVFGKEMHAKRIESLANAAIGLLNAEELLLHKMGEGLSRARGLDKKHATKQIDRLLSNKKLDAWECSGIWVPYIIGERKEILVSMDWTDFDSDNQSTIALNLIADHGRATPLLWKTVNKASLKSNRARYEDQILSRLKEVIPVETKVTVLADRGFADQLFFKFIEKELGFFYIIRIRDCVYVKDINLQSHPAKDWLNKSGRTRCLEQAMITQDEYPVAKFVCTKKKEMKDAWYLVSNRDDLMATTLVNFYGKRWKIEPYFRDIKNQRFGFGLDSTHISTSERRDRLFFVSSICIVLLTLLGAAGERIGFDRKLKVNTVKTRTHSLLRQGIFYYKSFCNFKETEKANLLAAFNNLLERQPIWKKLFFSI